MEIQDISPNDDSLLPEKDEREKASRGRLGGPMP